MRGECPWGPNLKLGQTELALGAPLRVQANAILSTFIQINFFKSRLKNEIIARKIGYVVRLLK